MERSDDNIGTFFYLCIRIKAYTVCKHYTRQFVLRAGITVASRLANRISRMKPPVQADPIAQPQINAMYKVLIIEDEPAVRKELVWLVSQEKDLNLAGTATNILEAAALIKEHKPQLVLMDIQLTDGTAFDLLATLGTVSFKIIFITAYNHFAIKAIKYGAMDYLLKPLEETELKAAIEKFRQNAAQPHEEQQLQLAIANQLGPAAEPNPENRIVLHSMDYLQVLQIKEIIYCMSDGSYTTFFLTENRKIMTSRPLKYYEELLPEQWFVRPHQSYLVNLNFVDKLLKSGLLILKNKTEVPVSIRKKDHIMQRLSHIG